MWRKCINGIELTTLQLAHIFLATVVAHMPSSSILFFHVLILARLPALNGYTYICYCWLNLVVLIFVLVDRVPVLCCVQVGRTSHSDGRSFQSAGEILYFSPLLPSLCPVPPPTLTLHLVLVILFKETSSSLELRIGRTSGQSRAKLEWYDEVEFVSAYSSFNPTNKRAQELIELAAFERACY